MSARSERPVLAANFMPGLSVNPAFRLPRPRIRAIIGAASLDAWEEEGAMCWRPEYDLYARTGSKPASSRPARSLMDILRELFRPRRPQVEQAQVVPLRSGLTTRTGKEVDHKSSKAA